jgi:hypothetical protein
MKKLLFLTLLFFGSLQLLKAQDKIYRNNGKVVLVKIVEVGASEIKYKEYQNPDGPVYVLETDRVKKIIYENGKIETFDNLKDMERYDGQKRQAIKANFLSPLYGYLEVGYEKTTGFGKSYEFSLGIIGAGKSDIINYTYYNGTGSQLNEVRKKQFGFFATGGYKFGKLPDFILFGKSRASHLMQGTYIKPLIYIGHYKENILIQKGSNNNPFEVGKQNVTFGALQIELGRQWVFGDKILLDIYEGLGYGIDNKKDNYQPYGYGTSAYFQETAAFNYGNFRLGKSPSLSFTIGLRVGLLLKNKTKDAPKE